MKYEYDDIDTNDINLQRTFITEQYIVAIIRSVIDINRFESRPT